MGGKWVHRISNIDESTKTGLCLNCGPVKLKFLKGQKRWACRIQSENWSWRGIYIRSTGITYEQFMKKMKSVEGKCEICGSDLNPVFDHDHKTNRARGILCRDCNTGLGLLKEDPSVLLSAIRYLEKEYPRF
jgi:ribosomal protein L34E